MQDSNRALDDNSPTEEVIFKYRRVLTRRKAAIHLQSENDEWPNVIGMVSERDSWFSKGRSNASKNQVTEQKSGAYEARDLPGVRTQKSRWSTQKARRRDRHFCQSRDRFAGRTKAVLWQRDTEHENALVQRNSSGRLKERDGLNACHFKALAAAHILARNYVVAAHHVGLGLGEAGAIALISIPRKSVLFAPHEPAQLIIASLPAMGTGKHVIALFGSLVKKFPFFHLVPPYMTPSCRIPSSLL